MGRVLVVGIPHGVVRGAGWMNPEVESRPFGGKDLLAMFAKPAEHVSVSNEDEPDEGEVRIFSRGTNRVKRFLG